VVAVRLRLIDMLRDEAVDVALQPIVSVVTGRMVGAEALARFRDGRGPEAWFAEARSIGFGLELDRLCFSAALDLLPVLPPDVSLSVNTSPELLVDPAFQQLLTGPDVDLSRLVVEVTEHVEIGRYDDIRAALLPVRERGLRLAVDDTGAGYASFSHVLQLRPDIIKIDRSLVSNVTTDPARRSLLTALVLLALDLGATVTAEGVEDRSELETLAALGVDEAQGYFLARPTTDPVRWARWSERTWHQLDPEPAPSVTIT
jgi:EAL domain-containing protein (putative c-di-GMP-specific phosphodiesterase class I)